MEPKRRKLSEAEEKLLDSNRKLQLVREKVELLEERKRALQDKLVEATEEKNRLLEQASKTSQRLNLAERLVNGLKDENERWGSGIESLRDQKNLLVQLHPTPSHARCSQPVDSSLLNQQLACRWGISLSLPHLSRTSAPSMNRCRTRRVRSYRANAPPLAASLPLFPSDLLFLPFTLLGCCHIQTVPCGTPLGHVVG